MRKRDLAILMLSAFAIFFTLQHEGDFAFKEAWFHLYEEYPVKCEADRLPPPLVADLDGDGKKEVLVATNDARVPHIYILILGGAGDIPFLWIFLHYPLDLDKFERKDFAA